MQNPSASSSPPRNQDGASYPTLRDSFKRQLHPLIPPTVKVPWSNDQPSGTVAKATKPPKVYRPHDNKKFSRRGQELLDKLDSAEVDASLLNSHHAVPYNKSWKVDTEDGAVQAGYGSIIVPIQQLMAILHPHATFHAQYHCPVSFLVTKSKKRKREEEDTDSDEIEDASIAACVDDLLKEFQEIEGGRLGIRPDMVVRCSNDSMRASFVLEWKTLQKMHPTHYKRAWENEEGSRTTRNSKLCPRIILANSCAFAQQIAAYAVWLKCRYLILADLENIYIFEVHSPNDTDDTIHADLYIKPNVAGEDSILMNIAGVLDFALSEE